MLLAFNRRYLPKGFVRVYFGKQGVQGVSGITYS